MQYRKLWIGLAAVMAASFAVLIYFGVEIYRKAPPIPERVVTEDGMLVFTAQDIKDGQNVWQSMGGQEVGSVWGHGAYVAPDWTADCCIVKRATLSISGHNASMASRLKNSA